MNLEELRELTPEQWQEFYERVWDTDEADPVLKLSTAALQGIGLAMLATIRALPLAPLAPQWISDVTEEMVAAGAQVLADSPGIDAPKLPAPCWMGTARAVIEAALATARQPHLTAQQDGSESANEHIQTERCGFDRNASISEDRYVCECGWRDTAPEVQEAVELAKLIESGGSTANITRDEHKLARALLKVVGHDR